MWSPEPSQPLRAEIRVAQGLRTDQARWRFDLRTSFAKRGSQSLHTFILPRAERVRQTICDGKSPKPGGGRQRPGSSARR